VPKTPAAAGRLPVVDLDGPPSQGSDSGGWSPDDSLDDLLANCPDLAGDLAWAGEAWLEDPERPDAEPTVREVLKAGFWDRTRETGAGFAAGGVNDTMPPGAVLAGRAEGAWAGGLGRLSDDELVGVLRAARRLASWAGALELAAAGDLWRRRTAEEDAGDVGSANHADDEIAAALTLTARAGGRVLGLALALARLPLTSAALAAGDIDLPRAAVIADEVTGLGDAHAAVVDRAVAGAAPGQTTGQLRAAARRAVLAADPDAAQRRKDEALAEARVERWDEHAGTAALAGRDLPPAEVLAADHHLTALAEELQAAGAAGTLDNLRAHGRDEGRVPVPRHLAEVDQVPLDVVQTCDDLLLGVLIHLRLPVDRGRWSSWPNHGPARSCTVVSHRPGDRLSNSYSFQVDSPSNAPGRFSGSLTRP